MKTLNCQSCNGALESYVGVGVAIKCPYCGTTNLLEDNLRTILQKEDRQFQVWLLGAMRETLSLDDIRDICYNLMMLMQNRSYDYDNIPGENLSGKIRELIMHCVRRGNLQQLLGIAANTSRGFALQLEAYNG